MFCYFTIRVYYIIPWDPYQHLAYIVYSRAQTRGTCGFYGAYFKRLSSYDKLILHISNVFDEFILFKIGKLKFYLLFKRNELKILIKKMI